MTTRDPRLGVIAAKLKCWAPDYQTALFAAAPDIGVGIPEWNPREIVEKEAGTVAGFDVTLSYEGHPAPTAATEESFGLEGSTTDDPITSHWNFELLLKTYGGGKKPDKSTGKMIWPQNLPDGDGKPARNPMFGVEAWAAPSLIWNHNFMKERLESSLIRSLGTIAKSVPGNPPELSGNRSWLCMRIRGTQRGNIWQLQRSWQLSGPNGFVPEMYQVV